MPCCSTKCPICILLYSNLVCCCWSSLYFPPLLQGDVEAVDPGNKAVAEPVGDVAAAEHESFNQGNGPRVHHWNKLETTSVISPLIFTLSVEYVHCYNEAVLLFAVRRRIRGLRLPLWAQGGQGPTRSPRAKESFPSGDLPPPFRLRPSTVSPSKRRIRGYSVRRRGKELRALCWRSRRLRVYGGSIGVHVNGWRVLEQLGVVVELRETCQP
ncbi:uncharacterized protein [Zea mays]|nr:uncharacterized protein LOC103647416 [Zea mays]|eukprot:XP_008670178.1 uncharacterized protein LOC103647416 [Zea mays]